MARRRLLDHPRDEHHAVDHATPMLLGSEALTMRPPAGRSPALKRWRPRPPLGRESHELEPPRGFVGRGTELTRLRLEWLLAGSAGPAVAVVRGLAGMGKTALAAEAIHLWHRRFDGVFIFQSKPSALSFEEFLRRLDQRLSLHSKVYRELCEEQPNAHVFLPPEPGLTGDDRYRLLCANVLEVLRQERLLLVLDNFETQLEEVASGAGYACKDRQWDHLLDHLAAGLPETGSRLLVTSRHLLASLASARRALGLALGPLPMAEAMIFLHGTAALRRLLHGDAAGRHLVRRLLEVSRCHPLIMSRLGALADEPEELARALDELTAEGFSHLPDLFAEEGSAGGGQMEGSPGGGQMEGSAGGGRMGLSSTERERVYLEDVAIRSVDLLLERASVDARRLLWVVTLASEPVAEELIAHAWSEPTPVGPLLAELVASGLLTFGGYVYACHQLVRERVDAWMASRPAERDERTRAQVWEAYGERYAAAFQALRTSGE
ncbi:MAG: AAA family ATPase, partial [Gammaproteobacteria bacterium]|nr:AAA family ATPase [Gammaproteobacteria bacterium]